ncbi:MAG: RHS repeat-associated protein [Parvicellaceae bacterium]|jgi:RHS repeat-associated protein
MKGRESSAETYRYGFNGMEKDDEFKNAKGADLDFGARMYDSRLGRWKSTDPLAGKYPWCSPYTFVANKPIVFIDPNGEIIEFCFSDADSHNKFMAIINDLRKSSDRFDFIFNALDKSDIIFNITSDAMPSGTLGAYGATNDDAPVRKNQITFNINERYEGQIGEGTVIEEFFHAFQALETGYAELIDENVKAKLKYDPNSLILVRQNINLRSDDMQTEGVYVETEAKLFTYIVLMEKAIFEFDGEFVSVQKAKSNDQYRGNANVGSIHLTDENIYLGNDITSDQMGEATTRFFNYWKDRDQAWYKSGSLRDKAPSVLNSTSPKNRSPSKSSKNSSSSGSKAKNPRFL